MGAALQVIGRWNVVADLESAGADSPGVALLQEGRLQIRPRTPGGSPVPEGAVAEAAVAEAGVGETAIAEAAAAAKGTVQERHVLGLVGGQRQLLGQAIGAVIRSARRRSWSRRAVGEDRLCEDDGTRAGQATCQTLQQLP